MASISSHHLLLSILVLTQTLVDCFVIAPPWANPSTNPCSASSWQLVYWPPTKNCYQIFSRGPCPETQELGYNPVTSAPECRCPHDLPLHWEDTDQCYAEYSRGPCEVNQYLTISEEDGDVSCVPTQICQTGSVFWPQDQQCYPLYTQGPCHKGDLLIINPVTAEPYCGCDPLLLNQYFYKPLKLCYEHYTKGPCEYGSVFTYNHTSDTTDCSCQKSFPNYFKPLGQCFEIETKGPCGKGQVFRYDTNSKRSGCQCRENYVYWEKTHSCYREFTPGPCKPGQFLVKGNDGVGFCSKNPCSKAHLYFPSDADPSQGHCYKVGGQGPCPLGELVVFETYSGKSYRGDCGCSPGYNQNYWPEDNKCYEWYSQGPCPASFMFKYNKQERKTECMCDTAAGFVFWNETKRCYRVYSQGPCPENAWLIPTGDLSEVYCECRNGFFFAPKEYSCKRSQQVSLPRNFLRNHRFETSPKDQSLRNATLSSTNINQRWRIRDREPSRPPRKNLKVNPSSDKIITNNNNNGAKNVGSIGGPQNNLKEEPSLEFFWDASLGKWSERNERVLVRTAQ